MATANQLDTLRHMLGINDPYLKIPKPTRNYAAVNPDDPKFVEMQRLGLVAKYASHSNSTQYDWYRVTVEGRSAAVKSHKAIRKTKAQRKYHAYLNLSDCCYYLTFREFLTNPEFKRIRDEA